MKDNGIYSVTTNVHQFSLSVVLTTHECSCAYVASNPVSKHERSAREMDPITPYTHHISFILPLIFHIKHKASSMLARKTQLMSTCDDFSRNHENSLKKKRVARAQKSRCHKTPLDFIDRDWFSRGSCRYYFVPSRVHLSLWHNFHITSHTRFPAPS